MSTSRFIVSTSGYGRFGMGLHFAQLVEESRHAGELYGYIAALVRPGDERIGILISKPRLARYKKYIPVRVAPARWYEMLSRRYEKTICSLLPMGPSTFMGFAGRSLEPVHHARRLGYSHVEIVSATSHVSNVHARHRQASQHAGFVDSWLSDCTRDNILQEYAAADTIYVHSRYNRASFVKAGIPERKLVRTHLVPNPRFVPPANPEPRDSFNVVYVGRIDSSKGIHILIDAFSRIKASKASLTLVGGWTSHPMKVFMKRAMAKDPRISVKPGDPLPILRTADVLVHPSYEDGFAYAPLEALCCGVPVIVTEDTGMQEHVDEGKNGFIVPSGTADPIIDLLDSLHDKPLRFDAKKFRRQFYG